MRRFTERVLYLYDQFGCGRSDRPPDRVYDYFTFEEYRDRLDEVRQAIGTDVFHLDGQSWGGWLALEYVLEYPERVRSLILADTSVDINRGAAEAMRAAAHECLSEDECEAFEELVADRAGDDAFDEPQEKVIDEHINQSDEESFEFAPESNANVYGVMWGPSRFDLAETTRLRDWSVTDRMEEIVCPTLILN